MTSTSLITFFLILALSLSTLPIPSFSELCNPQDKQVLLKLKNQLGNPTQLVSWDSSTDCCNPTWQGVTCDEYNKTYRIIILSLSDLNLPKLCPIPSSIGNLPFLQILEIRNIPNLVGPIPLAITNLTKLNYLYITHTNISSSIPEFISRIQTIVTINFSYNKLSGELPSSLSQLPNLVGISFNDNFLSGTIPESYGSFSNLFTSITLERNQLSGNIPATLAKLNLSFVDLSSNRFEGDASVFFGSEKNTQQIILAKNKLAFDLGKVELSSNLNTLDIRNNYIYGKLPEGLTALKYLHKLNVSYNNLCGEIPQGGNLQRFDVYSYQHNKCLCGSPLPSCKT
ncbi:unnamed protein product [Lupinus luteus]|uniref:Leucine-rich repeat-containing N-terminal plant-type domain-containing protein n=1 Tax=Lupinus luteus TaxID=3873 RepID=A0AAV1XT63_LUPLU